MVGRACTRSCAAAARGLAASGSPALIRKAGQSGLVRRRRGKDDDPRAGDRDATAPDLVRRDFMPQAPNRLWIADLTEFQTWEGKLYLAAGLVDGWPSWGDRLPTPFTSPPHDDRVSYTGTAAPFLPDNGMNVPLSPMDGSRCSGAAMARACTRPTSRFPDGQQTLLYAPRAGI
jgi:hypothetical protein